MYYFVKTPPYIKRLFRSFTWDVATVKKVIYLTFDDGPTPEVTNWVLGELQKYNAKATFFCIGKNTVRHPEIMESIIKNGHSVGNHTHKHLNGWRTKKSTYVEDVSIAAKHLSVSEKKLLFRPPYGRIKKSQAKILQKRGYEIVMWDVLSADFDTSISEEKCLQNVLNNATNGSIVVFHDSEKASRNLKYVLPKMLAHFKEKDFDFEVL